MNVTEPRHLLIIGAQRCGTTSLYAVLDAHPDIAMARPMRPEPKVFLDQASVDLGLDWYRATYFGHATAENVYGEKSTSYLEDPAAAARASAMLGPATIVVQLRDPVQRAISNWRFSVANGLESRPLETALAANLDGSTDWDSERTSVSPFAYLERGRYAAYLEPWLARFPDTTCVRFLEDVTAGRATAADLYSAIGVSPRAVDVRTSRENASEGAVHALDRSLEAGLRDYFAESDARLAKLLDRALPWPEPASPEVP